MKSNLKLAGIILAIVIAGIAMIALLFVSANNKAINLEEPINNSAAQIQVAEKRRVDLVYNLADAVLSYQNYEGETLAKITEARAAASNGNIEQAQVAINAVAEQYPDLKANENYKSLMTELALTENQIAQVRNTYNEQVRTYNKFVRTFPNRLFLNAFGYEAIDADYTDYDAPADAPQGLFDE